ncbi:DMT family transporter [Sediminibacillus halophilus]|uniref:Putative multidrug resistance efflux transporter n=1 Tax=Sediminibacillus halophilus TaxID=482461 RepID=A0A1G9TDW0_9BACI|nr:multidrug resistance efflux transporter family protein [Sediminibacillus halophilus]SDM45798.1 Putative multidrug resistance efflux transporter [Sediminibacillus halophilus]
MRVIAVGLLAALFFSVTFILNRSMELEGGSWVWSASLRFFFMLPMLIAIVGLQGKIKPVLIHLKNHSTAWIVWSSVGFGLFYAPIAFATVYGPGWLVAATFQLTIIAGSLLVPFLEKGTEVKQSIPVKSVLISAIILGGVILMQIEHASAVPLTSVWLCTIPLILSAFSYPLGNRKMMQVVGNELNTFQRILGMTIASMPFWLVLSVYGAIAHGPPSSNQLVQTLIVAVSSGIIATGLFFYATNLVKHDNQKLAGVEATQSGEVVFALIGEIIFLHAAMPSLLSFAGVFLVIGGMVLHSLNSGIPAKETIAEISKAK